MLTLGTPGRRGTSGSLQFCLCPIRRSSQVGLSSRFRTSPHLISVSFPSAAFFPFWILLLYLLVSGFLFCFDFELGDSANICSTNIEWAPAALGAVSRDWGFRKEEVVSDSLLDREL